VTVNWIFDNFEANQTFWTDSNGLEMQERILNYRPTWDLVTDQNISANYYPVNSGIAMRDVNSNMQATVINERSQAGSADLSMKNGIEIIQNRRLIKDDDRGVGEPLNETDSEGFGMQVNARYWLQIHDWNKTHSQQRQQQLLVDLPLQTYFAFDYTYHTENSTAPSHNMVIDRFDKGKYLVFPQGRNSLIARFENIGDLFDHWGGGQGGAMEVDLVEFMYSLWLEANHEVDPFTLDMNKTVRQLWDQGFTGLPLVDITEVDLTNNRDITDMTRHVWRGEDDSERPAAMKMDPAFNFHSIDKPLKAGGIQLIPQSIRTFKVEYKSFSEVMTQETETFLQ
jgi:hypothetical protein